MAGSIALSCDGDTLSCAGDDEDLLARQCEPSGGSVVGSPGSPGVLHQEGEEMEVVVPMEASDSSRSRLPVTRRPGHPDNIMTHSEARESTCVLCWEKSDLVITDSLGEDIRQYTHHNLFDAQNLSHPSGICNTCSRYLRMVKSGSLGTRTDPRLKWRKRNLSTINVKNNTVSSTECLVSGCPICSLARFNPIGKTGPKSIVNRPVMDPIEMDASIQPKVEPVRQETSCRTCSAPTGPGLPHPDCPQNQAARNRAAKERKKEEARRRRQEKETANLAFKQQEVEQEVEQEAKEQEVEQEAKEQGRRLEKGAVRKRERVCDLLLQQSAKAQEQILCDMLVRMGATKEVRDCFKLELCRPLGGRHLEVLIQCTLYTVVYTVHCTL